MKTIHRFLTLVVLLCGYACQDEEFLPSPDSLISRDDRATSVIAGSALTQNSSGYWVASRRVPLVGQGRIVDNMSDALISVLGVQNGAGNMTDLDIANSTSFAGVANVQAVANQIASVRDITRIYAGGQTAGFVYKITNTGLLTLNVLKGFWVQTLLKGTVQETKGGNASSQTLELNVLGAANDGGKQAVSISTTLSKPFDEVRIGITGVALNVLQALELYYAYVGDNPMLTATTNNTAYFTNGVQVHKSTPIVDTGWTSMLTPENAIDADLTNGAGFGLVGGLVTDPTLTIDFKKSIPAGTEVGFLVTDANVLSLGLLNGTILQTFDASNVKMDEVAISNLLGVSAIGGGKQMVSMVTTKACTQAKIKFTGLGLSVGVTIVNYAYVREPVVIDASSYLSLSNTTITGNSFQFAVPATGSMSYAIISQPNGATATIASNRISGMNMNGEYVVMATYTTTGGANYSQSVTITRNAQSMGAAACNTLLTTTAYGSAVYQPAGGGSLISLEGFTSTDLGKVVDTDPDNYITYLKGISIAGNYAIIGVQNGAGKSVNAAQAQIRTGFTVQPSSTLLGTDLLRFFRIRLKLGGSYVYDSLTSGNSAISAGLIGDNGNRIRLSVTTDAEYDAIELWTSGLLTLNLSTLRLYNAFWEPISANCYSGGAADACLELVTSASNGAAINYAETKTSAVASVGTSFSGLGNLLDNDKESVALITTTTVAGGVTVAVKFNQMAAGQEIGFIVVDPSGIANLNLLNWTTLAVYSNGSLVTSKNSSGALGADIIGSGARSYVSTIPTGAFDEVRITFAGVANVLSNVQLAGLFVRPDTNGDGIPDCAEGGSSNNPINRADALSAHVCEGDPVTILVDGGTVGTIYQLNINDASPNNADQTLQAGLAVGGKFVINALPAGDYYIGISSADGSALYYNGVRVTVHPKKSTWKVNAASSDWNLWTNWDNGSPWDCTDVVIPTNAVRYPVLDNVPNYCHYIHFEPGAEVVNTHRLNYLKAWVGLALSPGRYYMLSAPLKDMVTGDMFIPAAMNGTQNNTYFTVLNAASSPENRFNPRIYQRLWSNNAPGKKLEGSVTVTPDKTNWTPPFNALNQAYALGSGYSLMADKGSLSNGTLTFRFPKEHTVYNYYDASGGVTIVNEPITRSAQTGRFIYENSDGTPRAFPFTVTTTNLKSGNTFLLGNPFMAHININTFLAANTNITSIKVYDGNSNNSLIMIDGQLVSNGSNYTHIAPMQSFFVTIASANSQLTVNFTEAMLAQAPGNSGLLRNSRAATSSRSALRITAITGQTSGQCLLLINPKTSAAYVQGEDAESLLDNEVVPAVAVFSEADGRALDIQQLNDAERIPLGFSLRSAAPVTLKLNHVAGDVWSKWTLVDTKTGSRYSLSQSDVTIDAGTLDTHAGRFYLEKNIK